MATETSRSLAAVLFTDLVGSTALRASLGEERADELRGIHDTILGGHVEAHGGRVLKGTGDGLVAAFGSASDALTAAVEMQRALHRHNRQPGALAQLAVRMGMSVGDVSWDGGDCFGVPLVEAARLEARAEGGQILCTDYVRVMARGRGGHRFRPLGALDLKGLPEPVDAAEVEWEPDEEPESVQLPFPASLGAHSVLRFVGRERELGEADRLLKRADGVALLWVVGEPGIGKTRLATEVARRRFDGGAHVLFGRCDEDLSVPYQPFVAALRDYVAATPPARLRDGIGGHHLAELARVVPELAALAGPRDEVQPDPETLRYRLFEAVRAWLRLAGEDGRGVLLVLDDMHWAASSTVAMLAHLLRGEPLPLGIVATLRDTESLDRPMAALLDSPGAAVSARTIELRGLGEAGVGRLVEDATGRYAAGGELASRPYTGDTSDLARRIHAETAGNPLFVAAMVSGLDRGGAGHGELPTDVRSAVRRRTSRLSESAQQLLRTGALLGLEFDLRVLGRVLGLGTPDLLDLADEVTAAHLVEEVGPNRARFAHALVRAALRREIRPSRAGHLHASIAEAIEAVHPGRLDEHAEVLAYHYGEALNVGGPTDKALEYRLLAARRATAQFAHDAGAAHYRIATGLLEAGGQAGTRTHCETVVAQGEAEFYASAHTDACATLRRGARDAEAGGWTDLLARAALHLEQAIAWQGLAGDEAAELLDRADARLGPQDSVVKARVLAALGRALGSTARRGEAPAVLEAAVAMARRQGDEEVLAHALLCVWMHRSRPERVHETHAAIREAYDIARRRGLPFLERHAMNGLAFHLVELGQLDEVRALLARHGTMTERYPETWSDLQTSSLAGVLALAEGRLEEAERSVAATRDLGRQISGFDPDGVHGVQMFGVRREQGRLAEVAPALGVLARLGSSGSAWRPGLAALYTELGMLHEAQAELEALVVDGRVLVAEGARRSLSLSYLADTASALDDAGRAAALYAELAPYAGLWISMTTVAAYGPAERFLGALATTTGDFGAAQAHFEDALEGCHAAGCVTWTAHTQLGFARLLHRRGRAGDSAQAHLLARAARDTARRVGMAALERRAEALLAPAR